LLGYHSIPALGVKILTARRPAEGERSDCWVGF
jgi:hypothetical protein